jgi:hypothetical protein
MTTRTKTVDHTFHIRRKLAPRGGSQFYRDKSVRLPTTLCGASITGYDVRFNDPAKGWHNGRGDYFMPCRACRRIRMTQ